MTDQTVEYLVRLRFQEPAGALPPGQVGDAMHDLLSEIEMVATEQEIISRRVVGEPDRPPRVLCDARGLDPTRHYSTKTRWRLETHDGVKLTFCSAACTLAWICRMGIADDLEVGISCHSVPASEGEAAA